MRLKYGTTYINTPLRAPMLRARSARADRSTDLPGLDAFLGGARRVAVVVADATRATGIDRLMPALADRLRGRRATVVFANGLHRPTRPDERTRILGGVRLPTADHDARRGPGRALLGADRVIVTGTVGIHYLAGWGGGWKMIYPGCADERTILRLHRMTLQDGCEPGRLDGNPFRAAIDALGERFPVPAFAVQTVLSANRRIVGVFCGDVLAAHRAAVAEARRWHTVPIRARVGRIVASAGGHPKDINLIQAHKAIVHAAHALRPGGELVMLAACPDGLGFPGFERWFDFRSPAALAAALRRRFHVYGRTAWALWRNAARFRIRIVSELPNALVERLRMTPASRPTGADLVLPDAGSVLPVLGRPEIRDS